MKPVIYLLDDQETQRESLKFDLRALFGDAFDVLALELYSSVEPFAADLDDPNVAGVFIDQKLNETGEVTSYNGVVLCEYLRSLFPTMPIYLVTGKQIDDELKSDRAGSAEAVVRKSELRAGSKESLCLKQRFLRHSSRHVDALTATQRRFQELLELGATGNISADEEEELAHLQSSLLIATEASEKSRSEEVAVQIAKLESLMLQLKEIKDKE